MRNRWNGALDKLMGEAHAIQQEGLCDFGIYFLVVYRRLPLHRGIIKDARQLDDATIIASALFPIIDVGQLWLALFPH